MISHWQAVNRKAWVALLLFGTLKQCTGKLHNGVGYCCLGVAELSRSHPPIRIENGLGWTMNGSSGVMSMSTAAALGFFDANPVLWTVPGDLETRIRSWEIRNSDTVDRGLVCLSFLNDGLGLSLAQIGEIVKAQPYHWTGVVPGMESTEDDA